MPNVIVPDKPAKNVIRIDGVCYELVGPTSNAATHTMEDIQGIFDDCSDCFNEESSSESADNSSSSEGPKSFFGLSWTNGETKELDAGVIENEGSGSYFTFFGGPGYEFGMQGGIGAGFFVANGGADPFSLSFNTAATPVKNNIAAQWKTKNDLTTANDTIQAAFWGTSETGTFGTITANPGGQSIVLKWWRSGTTGAKTNMKISW